MNLFGTYGGTVEANNDSEKLGRLKVRVPHVYGATGGSAGYIGTNDLPWALPAGMPAGGSPGSGGLSHLPQKGDKVWVRFLDGEPEKPIWEWGMQSQSDAENLKLHTYDTQDGKVTGPNRAFWTRYGHGIELNAGALVASTSGGYRIVFTDSSQPGENDGSILLSTSAGNFIQFDDTADTGSVNVNQDLNFIVGSGLVGKSDSYDWTTDSQDYKITSGAGYSVTASDAIDMSTASTFTLDAIDSVSISSSGADMSISSATDMTLDFATLFLGQGAVEPFVFGNQLSAFLQSLLIYLDTHTHSNGNNGSPTGPPIIPTEGVVQPEVSTLVSSTVFGV
jgi:hypothetical protein